MTYEILHITDNDGILTVAINRPKALNALNRRTMEELRYLFETDAPEREGLRGIVLTGAGEKAFVAGADIKEFLAVEGDQGAELSKYGQEVFFLIERFPRPVVAAINGFALGGGCELAMACHLRVASVNAKFGQPEVNLGIIAGYGGTQRLVQLIGKTKATELLLTGDMLSADEALQLGMLNYVTTHGDELQKAVELIEKISQKGPIAVEKTLAAINAYFQHDEDGFAFENRSFGDTTLTEDFREGAQAFVEKRRAEFRGR